ncbi:MAG: polysaccharide biosynthesis tyrosine autokinase [Roseovarius sp.]|nr:polysaccharide biosynthesis tyrosine autokinase [Roseovarius sp.]
MASGPAGVCPCVRSGSCWHYPHKWSKHPITHPGETTPWQRSGRDVTSSSSAQTVDKLYPPRLVADDQGGATQTPADNDEIDLVEFAATIWRGKWLVALSAAVTVLIGAVYAFVLVVPLYTATTTVIYEDNQRSVAGLDSLIGGGQVSTATITTEIEVLRARSLMGKVVDRLDLAADPEFNPDLRAPGPVARIRAWFFDAASPATEAAQLVDNRERNQAITGLLERVKISSVRNSLVFDINVTTEDPRKSARIADAIADIYIRNQIEVKFDKMEQATEWLSERVVELEREVEAAEEAVSQFNTQTDLVSVEVLRGLERQLKDTRERIASLREARNASRQRLAALEGESGRAERAEIAGDTELTRLLAQMDQGRADADLLFDRQFQRVLERARVDDQRNAQQLALVEQAEQALSRQIEAQGRDLIQLQQLTRVADATRLLYEHFLTRLKETSAQQGIQQADSRVLSAAVVPVFPSYPRKSLVLALAGVLGVIFGVALVLLRELRSNGFRTSGELERHTGLNVMGQVPRIPGAKRLDILAYMRDKPTSAAMEAVRDLRTSLLLSSIDNPPQVIVSTSSIPGEGKTTNALALADNFVGLGKKVLLIEGDIRRRTLNEYFSDAPKHGIVSVLAGDRSLDEVVFRPAGFGADVILGDKSVVNAADLFSSERFRHFLAALRERYDVIIIDTPPVLVVPDARIIAKTADALLFSVRWDSTSRAQVSESLRQLHASRIQPTGLILSQINTAGMKRYGYGGRYGAYGGYGSKYYTN